MKKIFSLAAMAIAVAAITSCGNSSNPKADLKSDIDSLSYAYGVQYTEGLDMFIQQQANIDSIYMTEFFKGVSEGFNASENAKQKAYYTGIQIGQQLNRMLESTNYQLAAKDSTEILSRQNFLAGFLNAASKKGVVMTPAQADSLVRNLGQKIATENREKETATQRKASDDFIAAKAKEEGVQQVPESKVLYKVVKQGTGAVPTEDATVKVKYEGRLADGTVFDKSDEPVEFALKGVIKGFQDALRNMPVGSTWEIYIPQELAYGAQQAGQIPPYSPLTFTLELVDVVEKAAETPKK